MIFVLSTKIRKYTPFNLVFWVSIFGFSVTTLIRLEAGILPDGDEAIPIDKVFHILGFAWLTYFALRAFSERVGFIIVGLFLYGLLIEALQGITGYRTAEGADVIANTIGILFGYGLGNWIPNKPRNHRLDSK